MKLYKKIKLDEDHSLEIYGSNRSIKLNWSKPDWSDDPEQCFRYKNHTYYLSEFMSIHNTIYTPNPPSWMKEFDGYLNDSFFSGIVIKYIQGELEEDSVRAFTFIS